MAQKKKKTKPTNSIRIIRRYIPVFCVPIDSEDFGMSFFVLFPQKHKKKKKKKKSKFAWNVKLKRSPKTASNNINIDKYCKI